MEGVPFSFYPSSSPPIFQTPPFAFQIGKVNTGQTDRRTLTILSHKTELGAS